MHVLIRIRAHLAWLLVHACCKLLCVMTSSFVPALQWHPSRARRLHGRGQVAVALLLLLLDHWAQHWAHAAPLAAFSMQHRHIRHPRSTSPLQHRHLVVAPHPFSMLAAAWAPLSHTSSR